MANQNNGNDELDSLVIFFASFYGMIAFMAFYILSIMRDNKPTMFNQGMSY